MKNSSDQGCLVRQHNNRGLVSVSARSVHLISGRSVPAHGLKRLWGVPDALAKTASIAASVRVGQTSKCLGIEKRLHGQASREHCNL